MTEKGEKHKIAGTSYRQKEIKSLGTPNPDYQLNKSQLVRNKLVNVNIYEYKFKKFKAELVPEPTNEHDPNAIKVIISGKHVGYIKKGSCAHVKKLMKSNSIKSITATMKGGNLKYVNCYDHTKDSYAYESFQGDIGVEIVIKTIEDTNTSSKGSTKRVASTTAKTKQEQYEEIVKKGNFTKKKVKNLKTFCTITALLFILFGLLTISFGVGIIFLILGIFFFGFARLYGNILKNCFKE